MLHFRPRCTIVLFTVSCSNKVFLQSVISSIQISCALSVARGICTIIAVDAFVEVFRNLTVYCYFR